MTNRIDEIKSREAKATLGPWDKVTPDDTRINSKSAEIAITLGDYQTDWEKMERDAAFIAHSRADIPFLLAEVDRLRAERDALKEAGSGLDILLAEIETIIKTVSSRQAAYQAIVDGRANWKRALEDRHD